MKYGGLKLEAQLLHIMNEIWKNFIIPKERQTVIVMN